MENKIKEILSKETTNGAKSFKVANLLFKQTTNVNTYAECVKLAWGYIKVYEFEKTAVKVPISVINELLKVGYVTFGYYKKKTNEFRVFRATKKLDLIPTDNRPTSEILSTNLRFFEHGKGWRSCSGDTTHLYLVVDQQA